MGIRERGDMICKGVSGPLAGATGAETETTETTQRTRRIRRGIDRLVERGGGGMGRIYKVLAIVPENGGRRRPVGFGGDV